MTAGIGSTLMNVSTTHSAINVLTAMLREDPDRRDSNSLSRLRGPRVWETNSFPYTIAFVKKTRRRTKAETEEHHET